MLQLAASNSIDSMKNFNPLFNSSRFRPVLMISSQQLTHYLPVQFYLIFTSLFFCTQGSGQKVLLTGKYLPRVEHALSIVAKYEPDIYADIVSQSYIQLGEISGKPGTSFCIVEGVASSRALWIMLSPLRLRDATDISIASVIIHEAMHLRYNLSMKDDPNWVINEAARHLEHTTIYNYQLFFLKRVGAAWHEIEGVKSVMRSLSIPVIIQ